MKNLQAVKWVVHIIIMLFVALYAGDITKLNNTTYEETDLSNVFDVDVSISDAPLGYNNSPHDMGTTNQQSDDQAGRCMYCHTHNSKKDNDVLWNMSKPSGSFQSETDHPILASTSSLKCLSCHDGATAINNLPNGTIGFAIVNTISTPNSFNSLDAVFESVSYQSQDLGNNHPVGIVYDEGNPGLNAIADLKIAKLEAGTNKVTCASCHEPHSTINGSFLIVSNIEGSALCLDCHNK